MVPSGRICGADETEKSLIMRMLFSRLMPDNIKGCDQEGCFESTGQAQERQDLKNRISNKGHKNELDSLGKTITEGREWLNSLWQQVQTIQIAFKAEEML